MKISQLVISILVILLGGTLAMYTMDQQKVMNIVTATHGGGSQVSDADATGLRKANQELEAEAARLVGERSDAVKRSESARVEMRDARDKRNDAETKLAADKEQLSDTRKKVEAVNESVEQVSKAFTAAMEQLRSSNGVELPDTDNFAEVMDAIKSVVEREETRTKELTTRLEEQVTLREAAMQKLAKEKVELNRLNGINDRFFKNYVHNGDEFTVLAADSHWRFVVFKAGADSGLVAGDATPMLLKRGETVIAPIRIVSIKDGLVIAEFDPDKLNAGMRPEIGDRAFRMKPLGN